MVRINGQEFQIYDLDTDMSILTRIAGMLNTFPKYLYFLDGAPEMEKFKIDANIEVEDVLIMIKNYNNVKFTPLYEYLKNKIIISDLTNDLIKPFIVYNKEIKQQSKNIDTFSYFLEIVQKEIETLNLTENLRVADIWREKSQIIEYINSNIIENKKQSKEQVQIFTRIKLAIGISFSEFELEKDSNQLILDLNNNTLMEIFNYIKLNSDVPFASLNNFYKILKDFIPFEEWSFTTEDIILMVSPYIDSSSSSKINDYSAVIIEETKVNDNIVVNFYFNKSSNNLGKEELIKRILGIFPSLESLKIKDLVSDNISGVFYFHQHTLNKHVLSELIMNNPLFSTILSVNEGDKATTSRSSIYIYFNHPNTGPITATLTEKVMSKVDVTMRNKDPRLFPVGRKYIRVKIKNARDQEAVQKFQQILSKLMSLYYEEYPKIVEIYREFIPGFGVGDDEDIGEAEENEEVIDMFPKLFTRSCASKPTVITSEEEEKAVIEDGKDIMVFPKDQDEHLTQRKYFCNYKDKPYPGLIQNKDPNTKKDFPLLPCCYNHNPKDPNYLLHDKFREYYGLQEEETSVKKKVQQNLIKTNKFVNFQIFGLLPKDISKLFSTIDTDTQYSYLRTGVKKTKSSFLNCVLLAIGDEAVQSFENVEEIEAYLAYFREDLLSPELAAACKQEMYDYSTEEILDSIKDSDVYFDPKLFVHLLEERFNCNIFIFSRDNGMILPRHIQSYQKLKNNKPCILIYEHNGSESDKAEYPRCELIVKFNKTNQGDITYIFEQNNTIYRQLKNVYNRVRETYSLNTLNEENMFPLVAKFQKIDSYGKVRMVNLEYEDNLIPLMTSPMQPFAIQETMEETVSKVDVNIATRFASSVKMLIDGQIIIDGSLKEILGKIGNVRVSIPVKGEPLPSVKHFSDSLNYIENNTSILETYNNSKKLARYIVEYMIWLYSKFLRDNNTTDLIPEQMISFANQYITIDPMFEYGKVHKKFNEEGGVMHGRKLVVKSQETLKRLLYVLRLEAVRNPQRILRYHERDNIENFYIDITDFDQYQSQVILEGDDSVKKWSQQRKVNYRLHNDILIGNSPYFFKNKLVGNNLFLAQNTESIEKAIEVAKTWYEKGYNPSNTVSETGLLEFTLLAFGGPNNIKSYSIQGQSYPQNIKIIGYKINDKSQFTALLEI